MSISATRKFMSSCNSSFESSRHADFKNVSLHPRLRGRIKNPFLTLVQYSATQSKMLRQYSWLGILHQCVLLLPHSVHRLWQRQKNIDLLFHPILGARIIRTGRTSLRTTHRVTRALFSTLCVLKKSDISSHKSPTYEASSETLYTAEHAHAFLRSFLNERLFSRLCT